ncbi:uncharacterized protein LOC119585704 [Penaeus monodon]|uniref:uncharacterized protein LOC119585704 n=1 Tax=Penaeus monodon TaxID=6687 RepID=UPI0018A713B2|nr:uncharacterized protein LOC119585704 [Penaeus monodon]
MSGSSREVLAMETSHPDHVISFGKKKGCYVSRCVAALLGVFFLSGMVATGLLVYYYAPHIRDSQRESLILQKPVVSGVDFFFFFFLRGWGMGMVLSEGMVVGRVFDVGLLLFKTDVYLFHYRMVNDRGDMNERLSLGVQVPLHKSLPPPPTRRPSATSATTEALRPTIQPPTTSATAAPAAEALDVRLPTALRPLHYLIKLQPFINGNFSILGYMEVEMEVLEPTSNITLHIADIITHNDTVTVAASGEEAGPRIRVKRHQYDHDRQFYIAQLEQQLEKSKKYVLSMQFLGYLNDQLRGFYRSTYKDEDGSDKMLAVTQFQATDARRAFPCFDEPEMKATFEVFLAREENMSSISNMPIKETLPIENQEGWVWDHYHRSVPMSTYLVAFVVSDFANLKSRANENTFFRVWARESAIQQAEYAGQVGPMILNHFEKYFSMPYPLPKQDMIAIPDFSAGAMENWGLITYRETAMLYDPVVSAASNKQYVVAVVAHELAHQWFGNIVTPSWWTDLWLNEGFASYVEYIGINHVEPKWQVMEQFVLREVQEVFGLDCLESSHPISIPVGHPDEIGQIFDRISYGKGASIIRMMNHFLTEVTFRRGLRNYLDAFKYSTAEQDDLWEYLTAVAHQDGTLPRDLTVKMIMDTWTLQMGYPVVKVARGPDGTSAVVSQERFLLVRSENSSDTHDYKWWVPLTYTTQSEANFNQTQAMVWMKDSEAQISLSSLPPKDQWVIFNLQETGYYRVNYDDHNWNLLIQQLRNNHELISTINRAQIIDDAMNLAKAGQITYETALSVYTYLSKETEYVPLAAAINNLGYLRSMFVRAGGYGSLRSYLLDILVPLYESVGFEDSPDDPLLDQYKRTKALSWACLLGHQHCLDSASALYRTWMANPTNDSIISPNLKSTVYCRAIAEGGEAEWNFAWHKYLKSNVGAEKSRLLSALGCTNEIWILSRYLEMAFTPDSGIRKQDAYRVFGAVAKNVVGRPLAWNYLQNEWDKIYDFYGKAKPHFIKYATGGFNTEQHLKEVEHFRREHEHHLGSASRTVEQVIERTKNNIAWMKTNYDVIVKWLDANGYSTKLSTVEVEHQHFNIYSTISLSKDCIICSRYSSRVPRRAVHPNLRVMFFLGLFILGGLVNLSISNLGVMIQLLNCTDFPPNTVKAIRKRLKIRPWFSQWPSAISSLEKKGPDAAAVVGHPALVSRRRPIGLCDPEVNQTIIKDGKLDTRLPRTLKPLHYLVKLQPFINGNFSISGYMEVEMEVLEPTSTIILHMADIITKNDTVKVNICDLQEGRSIRVREQEYIREYQFYVARLEEQLERGAKYALAMEFVGYLSDELYGFYRLSYRDADGNNQYLAVTQFQPTHARRAFPCFDEPALKATFEVHLARETWMTSLSNMPLAETRPVEGQEGWVWDRFERSVPMSTYLVAFVVSDFVHINTTVDDRVLLRVWARESAVEDAKHASEIAAKILRFFEEYFSIPYPLKKLDIVALPDLTSDMENWGLITYRENSVLFNAESPIMGDKRSMIEAVAHELAHQWFGNLVTPKWWDDTWLNEGFATYMSVLGAAAAQAPWESAEAAGVRMLQQVFRLDSLQSSHKISIPVCHRDDINENFDSISYLKGASIIRMMSHFLGQDTFKKGLNNYLNSFKYSNAAQDDLWKYLTKAAHQDGHIFDFDTVKMFMDPWTLQKGYPVVRLARSTDRTSGIITQEHFISQNRNLSDTHDYRWWIPLTFTTRNRAEFNRTLLTVWLRDYWESFNVTYFSAEDEWVIFNLQQTGFYRVNYDDHNWNLLIQQLKEDHEVIHVFNRAQIIDDAMNLAKAGHLSYKVALGVYAYLSKESEPLPRTVAADNMKYLVAMLRGTAAFGALKRFILDVGGLPLYKAVGIRDSVDKALLGRELAFPTDCELGLEECFETLHSRYRQWMANPEQLRTISFLASSSVPPLFKSLVYCSGISQGGEAEWNFAYEQFLRSDDTDEKSVLLSALACSRETEVLKRYLNIVVNLVGAISKKHGLMRSILGIIGKDEPGRPLVRDFLTQNWNQLFLQWVLSRFDMLIEQFLVLSEDRNRNKYISKHLDKKKSRGELLELLTFSSNTKAELEIVERFLSSGGIDLAGNRRKIHQVLEKIRNNIAWTDANCDVIAQLLEEMGTAAFGALKVDSKLQEENGCEICSS